MIFVSYAIHQLFAFTFSRLHKCQLEGDCCGVLAVALRTESSQLKELDLSANEIKEAGVKALCVGLCNHQCKLETLRLDQLLLVELNHLHKP